MPAAAAADPNDYLKSGGVHRNLDVLNNRGLANNKYGTVTPQLVTRKEELYLSGYGRQWGEKLTYSTGIAYGGGERESWLFEYENNSFLPSV